MLSNIAKHARAWPDKAAVIDESSGEVMTFAQFNRRSVQCARLLRSEGLEFGDHISVMTENLIETLVVASAAARSGLYMTPVNWHLTANEVGYVITDCMAKCLVISPGVGKVAEELDGYIPRSVSRWIIGEAQANYLSLSNALDEFTGACRGTRSIHNG